MTWPPKCGDVVLLKGPFDHWWPAVVKFRADYDVYDRYFLNLIGLEKEHLVKNVALERLVPYDAVNARNVMRETVQESKPIELYDALFTAYLMADDLCTLRNQRKYFRNQLKIKN